MDRSKFSVLTLLMLVIFLAGATPALAHWTHERTDANESLLINETRLDGNLLVTNDEIGVFTPAGVLAGCSVVNEQADGYPRVGISAWGDDPNAAGINGLRAGELMSFKVWDHAANAEWDAEAFDFTDMFGNAIDGDLHYHAGDLLICSLRAARGAAVPQIQLSDNAHDFGVVRVGHSATWDFTVTNVGRADLTITDITPVQGVFAVNFGGQTVIAANQNHVFTVTFAPDAIQGYDGTVAITSDDPQNGQMQITLHGTGAEALPPTIMLSANDRRFGRVQVGQSRDLTVTISNTGEQSLTVSNVQSGDNAFTTNFQQSFDVAAGGNHDLVITFTPPDVGVRETDLIITSDDPNNQHIAVHLSGEGYQQGEAAAISVRESDHFYGAAVIGHSIPWRMVITNNGGSDLFVQNVTSNNHAFQVAFGQDTVRLRPGDYLFVNATFTPAANAFYDAVINISSTDPDHGSLDIPVSAEGLTDNGRHFQFYHTDASHSLLVTQTTLDGNALGAGSEIGVFTTAGFCAGGALIAADGRSGPAAWADDAATQIVDGFTNGEVMNFKVWDSHANVEAWGVAQFEEGPNVFSAGDFSVLTIAATSGAPMPQIVLSATRHDFHQVALHENGQWVLNISNHGAGALTLRAIDSDLNEFTTDFGNPIQIGAGQSHDVTVSFAPTAQIDYAGRLTVMSDDPVDSVLYVDLFGLGVEVVHQPTIGFGEANHYFGVQHLNQTYHATLTINNTGGGQLSIDSLFVTPANIFGTNWPGHTINVDAHSSVDLDLTFTPAAAQHYEAIMRLVTTDPDSEGVRHFLMVGDGSAANDHFLHMRTQVNHSLLIDHSTLILSRLGNQASPLGPGDEVAVFTPNGLCAGHAVVQHAGDTLGVAAMGDDVNNAWDDGFHNGDPFAFKYWDSSTRTEVTIDSVQFIQGPQTWEGNALTELNLVGTTDALEAQIAFNPDQFDFPATRVGRSSTRVIQVQNTGGVDLTVSRMVSNLQVFTTNFNNQPVVIHPGGSIDVTVTFTPANPIVYDGAITVTSDDPDQNQLPFHPSGAGSRQTGHYDWIRTDNNESIVVSSFQMGGADPSVGDEIGVFTPAGACAGSVIVTQDDIGHAIGMAAWGDDANNRFIDGFRANEQMSFHIWDASQGHEYSDPQVVHVTPGQGYNLNFSAGSLSQLSITVDGVFSLTYQGATQVNETQAVNLSFSVRNPPGNCSLAIMNPHLIDGLGDVSFTDHGNNTADFHWATNFSAAGSWHLAFSATNGDRRDSINVLVVVTNLNQAPVVVNAAKFPNDQLGFNEDAGQDAQHPNRDSVYVKDLDSLFFDPDTNHMNYSIQPTWAANQATPGFRVTTLANHRIAYLHLPLNWNGNFQAAATADDGQGRDEQGGARSLRSVAMMENPTPLMSQFSSATVQTPRRDANVTYQFGVNIAPVNDPPVIITPKDSTRASVAVAEGTELNQAFQARDPDNAANELHWTMPDRDGLPDAAHFQDNGDGTGTFDWTPTFDDGRAQPYTPTITVTDAAGGTDNIVFNIKVNDTNRAPVLTQPFPDYVGDNSLTEDQDSVRLAVMADHFSDPDQGQVLSYSVLPSPGHANDSLRAHIGVGQHAGELWAWPKPNYNTDDSTVMLIVAARDNGVPAQQLQDTFVVHVTPVNDAPTIAAQLAAIRGVEGSNTARRQIGLLRNNFHDVDVIRGEGDKVVYSLENDTVGTGLQIDTSSSAIFYQLNVDFNSGIPPAVDTIWVVCTDRAGASARVPLIFQVTSINDLPYDTLALVSPDDNTRLVAPDGQNPTVLLTWSRSHQNYWERDIVMYRVAAILFGGRDTLFSPPQADTFFTTIGVDSLVQRVWRTPRDRDTTIVWWVSAVDSANRRVWARNGWRRIIVPMLEVRESPTPEMPDHFFMTSNYPNPFNGRTTLRFGLTSPADVNVSVWDVHGRKVADLASGHQNAGSYELVWNANGMTSGVYIIKMQAGSYVAMQKAVLIR